MEKMKQSGVQWIGEIPASWNTKRIKYMATLKGRIGWQGLTSDEYQDEGAFLITGVDFSDGGIDWENCVHVPMKRWEEAKDIQIQNGVLLITKDGTIGKVAIVSDMPGETSLNSGVLRVMSNNGYSNRFLYWVLKSDVFWGWFNYKNAGNSTIQHLYQGDFAEFLYAFPKISEQEAIADFLNARCSELDKIISDLESQIETLKNYRNSLITETIIRGLDDKVELKESGIKWIGKVPVHYQVKKLKYFCAYITDGSHFSPETVDYGYPYITAADVRGVGINYEMAKKISEADYQLLKKSGCQPHKNDVLLVKDGATTGRVGFVTDDTPCVLLSSVAIIRAPQDMLGKYLMYMLQSNALQEQIFASMEGSAMPRTILSKIINYYGIVCPLKEQQNICQYLDDACSAIDDTILLKTAQLNDIVNHKSSLIFEYVTGKKRVKEVQ